MILTPLFKLSAHLQNKNHTLMCSVSVVKLVVCIEEGVGVLSDVFVCVLYFAAFLSLAGF